MSKSPNDYVTCPYNKAHHILRSRLTNHLERCSRNSGNSEELAICPFNGTHRMAKRELEAHVKVCENRAILEKMQEKKSAPVPPMPQYEVECEEDWDLEPDVPTYNPAAHCEQKLIVRSLQGGSRAARKNFREQERRRFAKEK